MKVEGYNRDTLLKAAVISPQLPKALDTLLCIETHAARWKTEFRITGDKNASKRFICANPMDRAEYNAKDAYQTDVLDDLQEVRLAQVYRGDELYRSYIELNAIGMGMRRHGVQVLRENFQHHRQALGRRRREARNALIELAGAGSKDVTVLGDDGKRTFNPASGAQLRALFLDKYGVQPSKWSEKTGLPSFDEAALIKVCGLPDKTIRRAATLVIQFRRMSKLLKSYIVNLPVGDDGRVHPSWNVSGAKTGRWSCTDPAFQTIPKPVIEKLKNGKEKVVAPGLRNLFGPTKDNFLVEVDFKQFEAFTLGLMSGDANLLKWLYSGDLHVATAKVLFNLSDDAWKALAKETAKKFRELAKRARYALHYGSRPETAWRALVVDFPDLTLSMVLRLWSTFEKMHSGIVQWQQDQVAKARRDGFLECLVDGRRFHIWGEVEPSTCYNVPNQMTVAAVANAVIKRVDRRLKAGEAGRGAALLGQVHDSLLAEGPDPIRLGKIIKEECELPVKLGKTEVVFPVDAKYGPNGEDWGNLTTLEL